MNANDELVAAFKLQNPHCCFVELPDLSSTRNADNTPYFISDVCSVGDGELHANLLVSVAAILSLYIDVHDISIGVQKVPEQFPSIFTLSCASNSTIKGLQLHADDYLKNRISRSTFPPSVIRNAFDLHNGQFTYPCIVQLFPYSPSFPSETTLVFSCHGKTVTVCSTPRCIHPELAKHMVSLCTHMIDSFSSGDPITLASVYSSLPASLQSSYHRAGYDELRRIYNHASVLDIATDYLLEKAESRPSAPAVKWYPSLDFRAEAPTEQTLSYASLNDLSNQVAHWLVANGLQLEDRIAVSIERNLDFHIILFGIMKAGGCYVPIDPDLPSERKRFIAEDSCARFVLTSSSTPDGAIFGNTVVFVELAKSEFQQHSVGNICLPNPHNPAYLLYTSGTTGTPKGCLLTHRGLSQSLLALSHAASDVEQKDLSTGRYLAVASIAFDVHLAETFVPVILGMPIISAPRSLLLENLPSHIAKLKISHVGLVPSLIEATLVTAQKEEMNNGDEMTLKYIASGGEKMSEVILDTWADHPSIRLANFYGPSEVTIGCCTRRMESSTPRINIGRPFANVSGYVVDPDLNILPYGAAGELVVEGPLVGLGYHGRSDLTEKVFISWPTENDRAYRTGDLVRMMPDSTLEILGRIDTQIKLRGVRIESEGISTIIKNSCRSMSSLSIDAATILAKHSAIGVEQLVSFFSWDANVPVATRKSPVLTPEIHQPPDFVHILSTMREACAKELPTYMRPSHILPISWLPLNTNGKIDLKRLCAIFEALPLTDLVHASQPRPKDDVSGRIKPLGELEFRIAELILKHSPFALGMGEIQERDLFECGFDSMTVIRLCNDLRNVLCVHIQATDIMKYPDLSSIARLVEMSRPNERRTPSFTRTFGQKWLQKMRQEYAPRSVDAVYPAFPVQRGVLARSASRGDLYVQHVILRLRDTLKLEELNAAWLSIISSHQILRTIFYFGLDLVQVVLEEEGSYELDWASETLDIDEDFVDWFRSKRESRIAQDINSHLTSIPAFRFHIYHVDTDRILVFSIHHALFDGYSLPLLLQAVESQCFHESTASSASATDVLDYIYSLDLTKAQAFWKEHFTGFPWHARNYQLASEGKTIARTVTLQHSLSYVQGLAARCCVTLQALLTYVFAEFLSNMYMDPDVTFGIIRSGRMVPFEHIETTPLPTLSLIPLRVNLLVDENPLRCVQEAISSAIEFEHVPLSNVQHWVRGNALLFETLFSVSNVSGRSSERAWSMLTSIAPSADYNLSVEIVVDEKRNTLSVQAAWKDSANWAQTAEALLQDFEGTMLGVAKGVYLRPKFDGIGAVDQDRKDGPQSPRPSVTPTTSDRTLTQNVASLVGEFLSVDPTVVESSPSFFNLGLDSLTSIGLARLLSAHGYLINPTQLLQTPTIEAVAGYHSSLRDPDTIQTRSDNLSHFISQIDPKSVVLSPDDEVQVYSCTALQAGLLTQTLASEGSLYMHAFSFKLLESVEVEVLRNAFLTAIRHLSILRTSFHFIPTDGKWVLAVHSIVPLNCLSIVLSDGDTFDSKVHDLLRSFQCRDEADFKHPPFHVRFIESDCERKVIVFIHHALYDGLSLEMLFKYVHSLYLNEHAPEQRQFVELLPSLLREEQQGLPFWEEQLANFHPRPLTGGNASALHGAIVSTRRFRLESVTLEEAASRFGVTPQALVQAALVKLLFILTRSNDVVFGHVVAARNSHDAESVIGPVLNTIPCRARASDTTTNKTLTHSIHETNIAALPWQHTSLRSIQKAIDISNLIDVLFLFQKHQPRANADLSSEIWEPEDVEQSDITLQYPVAFEVHQYGSDILIHAGAHASVADRHQLEGWLVKLQKHLFSVLTHPEASALEEFNATVEHPVIIQEAPPEVNGGPVTSAISDFVRETGIKLIASASRIPEKDIDLATPFMSLGIDSISAIQLVSKGKLSGIHWTVKDIVSSTTVADLLRFASVPSSSSTDYVPQQKASTYNADISDNERRMALSLVHDKGLIISHVTVMSPGMKWLIAAWVKSEGTRFQHVFAYHLPSDTDLTKLRRAWGALVNLHEILRSSFVWIDGRPDPLLLVFEPGYDDLSEVHTTSLLDFMKAAVASPAHPGSPMASAKYCITGEGCYLVLHLHHFQYDAWSLRILLRDLASFYQHDRVTPSNTLLSFVQSTIPTPETLGFQRRYWEGHFRKPFNPRNLPSRCSATCTASPDARVVYTATALRDFHTYKEQIQRLGFSVSALFLCSWAKIQSEHSGTSSVTLGLWQSGRTGTLDGLGDLAVPCMNVLPMHIRETNQDSVDLARRIHSDLNERIGVIEQSDLLSIHEWISQRQPLCNVFVNLVPVSQPSTNRTAFLEPVQVPHLIPTVLAEHRVKVDDFPLTELLQDDLFIDIVEVDDTVVMSVDAASSFMCQHHAKTLVESWSDIFKRALEIESVI